MEAFLASISQHGYPVLFALVFAEAIGLPLPAALALLIAGGSCAKGPLQIGYVLMTAVAGLLLGDVLLFMLGRRTGWWLLGFLCKLALNPESCVLRSAQGFRRHGRIMLLLAKFVPGLNTLGAPLAGSMNMRFVRFFPLDFAGASLYALAWCGVGYLSNDFLASVVVGYKASGRFVGQIVLAGLVVYFGYHALLFVKSAVLSYVPLVSAAAIARDFYSGAHHDMVVFDVRSHGYYSKKALRIKGSDRLDPITLTDRIERSLPKEKEIVLYCTCRGEATSIRVARILHENGFRSSVIKGGLRAWKKGGFPMETVPAEDVVLMPTF